MKKVSFLLIPALALFSSSCGGKTGSAQSESDETTNENL